MRGFIASGVIGLGVLAFVGTTAHGQHGGHGGGGHGGFGGGHVMPGGFGGGHGGHPGVRPTSGHATGRPAASGRGHGTAHPGSHGPAHTSRPGHGGNHGKAVASSRAHHHHHHHRPGMPIPGGYGPGIEVVPVDGGVLADGPVVADVDDGGVRLLAVARGGAADRAGLQADDVILSFDGVRVRTFEELQDAVGGAGAEAEVVFINAENGQTEYLTVQPRGGRIGVTCE